MALNIAGMQEFISSNVYDGNTTFSPGDVIPVMTPHQVYFSNSTASVANNLYFWNEDNLTPRTPLEWLEEQLYSVRSKAWR